MGDEHQHNHDKSIYDSWSSRSYLIGASVSGLAMLGLYEVFNHLDHSHINLFDAVMGRVTAVVGGMAMFQVVPDTYRVIRDELRRR